MRTGGSKTFAKVAGLAGLAALCASCSFMNLDHFDFSKCEPKDPHTCDEANRHDGIDPETACEVYACKEGSSSCVLGPRDADGDGKLDEKTCGGGERAALDVDAGLDCDDNDRLNAYEQDETCDDHDNDCDGKIDEGDDLPRDPPHLFNALRFDPTFVSVASNATDTFIAFGGGPGSKGQASGFVFSVDDTGEDKPVRQELDYQSVQGADVDVCSTMADCAFDEVAMAPYAGHLIYATIERLCPAGRIRLGTSRTDSPFEVLLGKPKNLTSQDLSYIELGVQGTGCIPGMTSHRVSGAAIAVLEPRVDRAENKPHAGTGDPDLEALALWLVDTDSSAQATCKTVARPVQALRLLVRSPQDEVWLSATGDGVPTPLDSPTTGTTAPSLVAWNGAQHTGYFVAYAVDGGVLIGFLPLAADVDAKPSFEPVHTRIDAPNADGVALSLGSEIDPSAGVRLRVAWRQGCDNGATVESAELTFDAESEAFSKPITTRIAEPGAAITAGPSLLYATAGFAIAEPRGGWVVLWTEGAGTSATATASRIRESTHESLGHFSLPTDHVGLPFLYPSDNAKVRYGLIRAGATLGLGEINCSAMSAIR